MEYKFISFTPVILLLFHLIVTLQLEDALHHLHLSRSRLQPAEGHPIVHHQTSTYHIRTPVDGSSTEGHLEQVAELIELLHSGLRVHQSSIVANYTISAHQQVVSHRVSEDLHAQSVSNDLLSLLVEVGMDEGHIIVTSNAISQSRQFFLHPNNFHSFGEGVADVPQFVVSSVVGYEEAFFITGSCSADNACSTNSGLDDWNEGSQLTLEDTVEVVGATGCHQAVAVCQLGEDTDIVRVLVLHAVRHQLMIILIQQKNKYISRRSDQFWRPTLEGTYRLYAGMVAYGRMDGDIDYRGEQR